MIRFINKAKRNRHEYISQTKLIHLISILLYVVAYTSLSREKAITTKHASSWYYVRISLYLYFYIIPLISRDYLAIFERFLFLLYI